MACHQSFPYQKQYAGLLGKYQCSRAPPSPTREPSAFYLKTWVGLQTYLDDLGVGDESGGNLGGLAADLNGPLLSSQDSTANDRRGNAAIFGMWDDLHDGRACGPTSNAMFSPSLSQSSQRTSC